MKSTISRIIERHGVKMSNSQEDLKFRFMLLSRLMSDCRYFLDWGRGNAGLLVGKSVTEHIKAMKSLYHSLDERPEWCKIEDISDFSRMMRLYDSVDDAKLAIRNCHEKVDDLCVVAAVGGKYMVKGLRDALLCAANKII